MNRRDAVSEPAFLPRKRQARPDAVSARVAGALLIAATGASLLSSELLNGRFSGSDYLLTLSAHQDQIVVGVFFQIVSAFAGAGTALSLYPVLKQRSEALALGSVGFRLLESALYLVAAIGGLLLLHVGQAAAARSPVPSYLASSGGLLRTLRNEADLVGILAFYLGASMYYYVFLRSGLIPRWLSAWGLAGIALGDLGALLVLFRVTGYMSTAQVALNVPIGVNEIVLAIWLLARGFESQLPQNRDLQRSRTRYANPGRELITPGVDSEA